jgi:A1 cistron-splicing factor AAR2
MVSLAETIDEHDVDLYMNLAIIVQDQMRYMDRDFFEDVELSGGNFFLPAMLRLVRLLLASRYEILQQKAVTLRDTVSKLLPIDDDSKERARNYSEKEAAICSINLDDTDGPVVVSHEEYEASLARPTIGINATNYPLEDCRRYPLLLGYMQPDEDVLMVCARILDTRPDVSLVREAAGYLEEVEDCQR